MGGRLPALTSSASSGASWKEVGNNDSSVTIFPCSSLPSLNRPLVSLAGVLDPEAASDPPPPNVQAARSQDPPTAPPATRNLRRLTLTSAKLTPCRSAGLDGLLTMAPPRCSRRC